MPLAAPVMKMVCRVIVFALLNLDHHYANTFWVGYQGTCAQRSPAVCDASRLFQTGESASAAYLNGF